MRALILVAALLLVKPDDAAVKSAPVPLPLGEWNALVEKYVDGQGRVDYAALKANRADLAKFERLFAAVAASSPKSAPEKYPSKNARAAYYLDAYNILVWKNVLGRLPLESLASELKPFFHDTEFLVGGKPYNLSDLENEVIRPELKDPRIHMALNCASGGCPQLPRRAFTPQELDEQLTREARKFVAEKRNVDFDAAKKVVRLSHIFDWYKADFGDVLPWINRHRETPIPLDAKIEYVDYDWTLNDRNLKR
jgi:hypothetical protein